MTTVALKHAGSLELSKDDQAVVKEFNSVLRKHAKRSAGSLARLAGWRLAIPLAGVPPVGKSSIWPWLGEFWPGRS